MANEISGENPEFISGIGAGVVELIQQISRGNNVVTNSPSSGIETQPTQGLREPLDTRGSRPNHSSMNTPSREEFEAKIQTIEARMDGRVASIEAKIDGLVNVLNERFRSMDERMGRMEDDSRETKAAVGNLKSTLIVTAISTVLAIVLGVAAFNATVLSNMVASFESGKSTSAAQAEVKKQAEETAGLLKQVQQQLDDARKSAPAPK